MSEIEVVLFDLGGVLADLRDPVRSMSLSIGSDEFWRIWTSSDNVQAFESGRMSLDEFAPAIAVELNVTDIHEFEERLRRWELALFDYSERLIAELKGTVRLALLSNTNVVHWNQIVSQTDVFGAFSELFLSYETGLYKPEQAAFEHVLDHLGCSPSSIRFLDDTQANVDTATALGFDAQCVKGPIETREAVRDLF